MTPDECGRTGEEEEDEEIFVVTETSVLCTVCQGNPGSDGEVCAHKKDMYYCSVLCIHSHCSQHEVSVSGGVALCHSETLRGA